MLGCRIGKAHDLGKCPIDVDVVADGRLTIARHVLGRRVSGGRSVAQRSPRLNLFGNKRRDLLNGGNRCYVVGGVGGGGGGVGL